MQLGVKIKGWIFWRMDRPKYCSLLIFKMLLKVEKTQRYFHFKINKKAKMELKLYLKLSIEACSGILTHNYLGKENMTKMDFFKIIISGKHIGKQQTNQSIWDMEFLKINQKLKLNKIPFSIIYLEFSHKTKFNLPPLLLHAFIKIQRLSQ